MSALTDIPSTSDSTHDQFVVSHGKSGVLGVFTLPQPLTLPRGQSVLVHTSRGLEVGTVLCPASLRQARILGAISSGSLVRCLTLEDETANSNTRALEQRLFETGRALAE